MAIDLWRKRLIVAALGNNTVEVIDLGTGKPLQSLCGLNEPHGVAYTERTDLLFIASAGDGSVRVFRAVDLAPLSRIELRRDADNIRINSWNGTAVVRHGDGGLAIIDPVSRAPGGHSVGRTNFAVCAGARPAAREASSAYPDSNQGG